jgi:hypothetical protein
MRFRDKGKWRQMAIWPRKMVYSIVDLRVWAPCAFGAKFENGPILIVLVVEKFDELIR